MFHGVRLVLIPLVVLLAGQARGAETYVVRMKPRGAGTQSATEFTSRVRLAVDKYDAQGQPAGDVLRVFSSKMAYETTILQADGGTTRMRRKYGKVASSVDGGDEHPEPVQDRTLLFVTKDGKTTVLTEKGEPLPEELAARLEQQGRQAAEVGFEELMPKKPVGVGDSWPVDAAAWVKRKDVSLSVVKATAQLVKVYRKDGRQFGVFETRTEMTLKTMTFAGRKMDMQPGSRILAKSTMDACIDGSSTECLERGTYLFTAIVRAPGPDGVDTKMDQEIEVNYTTRTK